MNRDPLASKSIASLGYDAEAEILEIEFRENGYVYQYLAFPQGEYDRLITSRSVGQYFNKYVRDQYPCARVED